MNTLWITSKWSYADLNGKTVEVQSKNPGNPAKGIGEFSVKRGLDGKLAIDIVVKSERKALEDVIFTRHHLRQGEADRIHRHTEPTVAAFQVSL